MVVAFYGWAVGVFASVCLYFIGSWLSAIRHAPDEVE